MPNSRQRAASPLCPAEVSIMMVNLAQVGLLTEALHQREAVHARHLRVHQQQGKADAPAIGFLKHGDGFRSAGRQLRPHTPVAQHLSQNATVGRIIIHHQHRQPG